MLNPNFLIERPGDRINLAAIYTHASHSLYSLARTGKLQL
jgi:hypothetical protein